MTVNRRRIAWTRANAAAIAQGTVPADSLVTISEEASSTGRVWRVSGGSRDYIGRRGGDTIVLVDYGSGAGRRVIRGQLAGEQMGM